MITKLFWNVSCTFTRLYGKFQLLKYQWEEVIPKNLQNKKKYEKSPKKKKKKRRWRCCEGRSFLWSQNSSEMCLVHLQGCMESFSFSNISEKKLYLKIYKIKRNMKNLQKKKRRRWRCCEGRSFLWSQNSSEMCLVHLQGCMESFSFSNISEKKLYLKIYKIKRNMKNLKKKKRKKRGGRGR